MVTEVWIGPGGVWTWNESGCVKVHSDRSLRLEECKAACDKRDCNAIMHHQTSGYSCYNFKCPYPLPSPPDDYQFTHHWVEYYRATPGTKSKYRFYIRSF